MLAKKEQELLKKLRSGNAAAFAELVDGHKGLVFTLALGILGNREDAEEVAQEEKTAMVQACLAKLPAGDAGNLTLFHY